MPAGTSEQVHQSCRETLTRAIGTMGQLSFSDAEYAGKRKKTRREVFLEEMELVVLRGRSRMR